MTDTEVATWLALTILGSLGIVWGLILRGVI
jgi:hypothetical protein